MQVFELMAVSRLKCEKRRKLIIKLVYDVVDDGDGKTCNIKLR
jgi:hypothetical protein